jgi:hypothetical protein
MMILMVLISCLAQTILPIEITVQTAIVAQLPETPDPATIYIVATVDELDKKVYHVAKDILFTIDILNVSVFSAIQEDETLLVEIYKVEDQI